MILTQRSNSDLDEFYEEWYCIRVERYYCYHCSMEFDYLHNNRKILVWPERDDPQMLDIAQKAKDKTGIAQIVEYETSLGPCISYYNG